MTVLLINQQAKDDIARAVEQARAKVIPWDALRATAIDDRDKPTNTLMLSERKEGTDRRPASIAVHFVGGVTAAISFEEQPAGICRHLSVATGKPGPKALLNPVMMAELVHLFGFRDFPPRAGRVWLEEFKPNFFAVNIVELDSEREAGHA
jgi:hypothetical protein